MNNLSATYRSAPQRYRLVDLHPDDPFLLYYVYGEELDSAGNVASSPVRLKLPSSLVIKDTSTHQHCPTQYQEGTVVVAIGPFNDENQGDYRLIIDNSRFVQKKSNGCEHSKIETQSSIGESGQKGQKGDTGFGGKGDKGSKGDKGDKGDKGSKGDKGAKSEKGSKGDKGPTGAAGSKGQAGDSIDWNSTQQSISIGSKTFGPRLIGVCQNGTYKYIYVFASNPES